MASALSVLVLSGLLIPAAARAQVPMDTTDLGEPEAVLEPLTGEETTGDPTALLELIEDLRAHPLDVNAAGAEELAQIPVFSPLVARAVVRHRTAHGPFASVAALEAVEGVTAAVLAEARPYLTAGEVPARDARYPRVPSLAEVRAGAHVVVLQRMTRRLDLGRGYEALPDSALADTSAALPSRYAGSPVRLYTRLQARYRRSLSANLTLEKDPGEPFEWAPGAGSYGYDYASFHLAALRLGRVEALVAGDFVAEFGQGLVLWRASGFGKGRQAVRPLVRRGRGVRPYGSTDENRFFRGLAGTVALTPYLYASAFASRRTLDASVAEPDTARLLGPVPDAVVTGLAADGLHRTPTERAKKDALGETAFGGGVELRLDRAVVGAVGYRAAYDDALAPGDRPYERFAFAGDAASVGSLYGSGFLGDLQLFGEAALAGEAVAALGGIEVGLEGVEAVVLARYYPRDFAALHGHGFGERNGATQNETGLYTGLALRPARTWAVSGFFDLYRFPWVRFAVPRPATGYEALLFVEHRPRRWLTLYAQGRTETREAGADVAAGPGAVLPALVPETRQSLRVQGEFLASDALRLRARAEASRYRAGSDETQAGFLLYQDVRWAPRPWLRLDARLTLFDAEGYGARLYQFESDLTGVFQNTLLYGRGTRAYALVAVRPGGRLAGLDLRLKLAATRFEDRRTVGSGLDEVDGDRVRDLALQLRYRF